MQICDLGLRVNVRPHESPPSLSHQAKDEYPDSHWDSKPAQAARHVQGERGEVGNVGDFRTHHFEQLSADLAYWTRVWGRIRGFRIRLCRVGRRGRCSWSCRRLPADSLGSPSGPFSARRRIGSDLPSPSQRCHDTPAPCRGRRADGPVTTLPSANLSQR